MASPLEIRIDRLEAAAQGWRISYSLRSRSASPIYLVQDDRFPFIRFKSGTGLVEVWLGIPPRSEAESNIDFNALVLPKTVELQPGATTSASVSLKWPLKLSGYWLDESDGPTLPVDPDEGFPAVLVVGFGTEPLDGRRIRSIENLYGWQITVGSEPVTLKRPPPR